MAIYYSSGFTHMFAKSIVISLLVLFHSFAYALEESEAVSVSTILKTQTTWDGTPIVYPSGQAEVTGMLVEIAVGAQTGWHLHPVPSFAVIVQGELEVHLKSGEVKQLKAGDGLAEVVNTMHNGHNVGNIPVKLFVFYTGVVGDPLSYKDAAH
jgi:quercetin dioxygenase-like cupin family protein